MKDKWSSKLLLILILLILTAPSTLCAATITLRWQPNAEPDLRGYYIYFGMQPRSYGPPINVDLVTTYTLEGLEENTPYYFAVSAIDTSGNESGFSEEISRTTSLSDTFSPTISITNPVANADGVFATDSAELQISGTAQDNREVTQVTWRTGSANGVAEGTNNWVIPGITLNEGLNTVTVMAADASGNTSSATISISYTAPDTTPPAVVITSPVQEESYTSANPTIALSGTASDDRALQQVSWESSTGDRGIASGTESWTIDAIELVEGLNTITVTASDSSGNTSPDTLAVTYISADTLSPTLSITSPAAPSDGVYETDNAVLQISGTAQDDRGITQVTWQAGNTNGVAEGTSNWIIPKVTLNEGLNVVTVTAADDSGKTSSATISISYTAPDTAAPIVTITTPTRDDVFNANSNRINLAGTAADESGLSQITWRSSDGTGGLASGTDNWSIADIPLAAGRNIITITATDLAGNSSSDHLTVVYSASDTKAPTVTIKVPTERSRYLARTSTVSIGGAASDNIGIAKVEWRNSRGEKGTCRGTDNWQTPGIKLNRWWNTITITAFDKAGNSDQKQLRVFRWR